ncbi:MAG: hypothetical protein Q4Q21_02485 [Lachnospiraceae bacterium]|nr:hypothetical protein [Lachnospiraceae bacterium]
MATFSEVTGQDVEFPEVALDFFYHSQVYQLINDGVSVMHCMSDVYLAEELGQEYTEKTVPNGNDS